MIGTERENAGRYLLIREIARGACGIVYRARDLEMGRTVALKKFRYERLGAVARERFLQEARLAAKLDHPGIVPVYGFGFDGGQPFYTMPMLRGRPLSAALREGPAEIAEVLRVGLHVARALRYAHGAGVLHRDVKPSNIVLCETGRVVLTDFGLARAIDPSLRLTETGELLGTPHYMSPEQMRAEGEVGPGSDMFSLGCVLYEMLCGSPPFHGSSLLEVSARLLNDDPAPPRDLRPETPPELSELCLSLLQRSPSARPAAREAVDLLDGLIRPRRASVVLRPAWPSFALVVAGLVALVLAACGLG